MTNDQHVRELTSHKVNGLNEVLKIEVLDDPGQGNACHHYVITQDGDLNDHGGVYCEIIFQNGPILEVGVNGISNEALLSVVEDRLIGFQSGEFACDDNATALMYLQMSMDKLLQRTRDRMSRGVEGTHQK